MENEIETWEQRWIGKKKEMKNLISESELKYFIAEKNDTVFIYIRVVIYIYILDISVLFNPLLDDEF